MGTCITEKLCHVFDLALATVSFFSGLILDQLV